MSEERQMPRVSGAISTGLLNGIGAVFALYAFAVLVFTGPLVYWAANGFFIFLVGATIVTIVWGWFGRASPYLAILPVPVAVAMLLLARAVGATADEPFGVLVTLIVFVTVSVGLTLLLLAWMRWPRFIQFVPASVAAGVYTAAGIFIVSIVAKLFQTMLNSPLGFSDVGFVVGVAIVLVACAYLKTSQWILLAVLVAVVVVACIAYPIVSTVIISFTSLGGGLVSSVYVSSAEPSYWGLAAFGAFGFSTWISQVDGFVLESVGLAVALFVAVYAALARVELEQPSDAAQDWNRSFAVLGAANLVAGIAAGVVSSFGTGLRASKSAASVKHNRIALAFTVLVFVVALALSGILPSLIPVPVALGVALAIGISTIGAWAPWLVEAKAFDRVIAIVVLASVFAFGFAVSVLVGALMVLAMFVYRTSQSRLIKSAHSLDEVTSATLRSIPDQAILKVYGARAQIYRLQGYLLLGSVRDLSDELQARWNDSAEPSMLVFNLKDLNGHDSAAVERFSTLVQYANARNIDVLCCEASPTINAGVSAALNLVENSSVTWVATEIEAIVQCEERVLEIYREEIEREPNLRDLVLRSVAPQLTEYLDQQAEFEAIVEELAEVGSFAEFDDEAVVTTRGEASPGLQLLVAGKAVVKAAADVTLRELRVGVAIDSLSAVGSPESSITTVAEGACRVLLLSPEQLTTLEAENEQLALRLFKYLVVSAGTIE